ncbi:MAG: class I SAM-dependent methyltransferase [Acidimicrobiia bacterium]
MSSSAQQGSTRQTVFGPIVIEYDDTVIEPRAWTLAQSCWAAELAGRVPAGALLELYCGAGHIGLAAAHLCGRPLVQVDDDAHACEWARRNARRLGLDSDVRCAPIGAALHDEELFPLLLADPPYLRTEQVNVYPDDPAHAIDGGPDGLGEIRRCLGVVARRLSPEGAALLQVRGAAQGEAVAALLAATRNPLHIAETKELTAERAILLLRASS